MNSQVLRIIVLVATIFPFVVLGFKIFEEESLLTGAVYAAIVLILLGTLLAASRAQPARDGARGAGDGGAPSRSA